MKNLIIIGDGETAELAHDYFLRDTEYNITEHAVDSKFKTKDKIGNKKVITIEELENKYDKKNFFIFVAISHNKLNTIREKYFRYFKEKGYKFASYISSRAFIWHDVQIGENAFILENNVIQKGCKIKDNVTLWSGNHIGHRSIINENCFITSAVVISGYTNIGKNTYVGTNSTIINNIEIGNFCFLNANSLIKTNLNSYVIVNSKKSEISKIDTKKFFKI